MRSFEDAERVFGLAFRLTDETRATAHDAYALRERLRALMADHRGMLDAGVDITVSLNNGVTTNIGEENASRCADVARKSACTMASAGAARPCLPLCDRWPDCARVVFPSTAALALVDTLGHESRPSLPRAISVATEPRRVGPTAVARTELESSWAVPQTLTRLTRASPLASLPDAPGEDCADACALQQDGSRVWPPAALRTGEASLAASDVVNAIADKIEALPERLKSTNGVGGYIACVRESMGSATGYDLRTMAHRDVLGLGVGLFVRGADGLKRVRKHALHGAMSAHVRGQNDLASSLERLADLVPTLARTHEHPFLKSEC